MWAKAYPIGLWPYALLNLMAEVEAIITGNERANYQRILDNKGRKHVFSIKFGIVSEIPNRQINEIIQEAILLDTTKPCKVKKRANK